MITYDVHNHVGLDTGAYLRGWWPYASTAQDMLQHIEAAGIDRAVVFPFGVPSAFDAIAVADRKGLHLLPDRVPFDRENALLVKEIDRLDADGRLLALAMFDPSRHVAQQVENLLKLQGKFAGLKVQATVLESPISALLKEGRPLMELAEANSWPVLIHTSIVPSDIWSPAAACLEVAAAYPKARFNLAHSIRFHEPSLRQAAKLPNVWVDCSAHLIHCQLAVDNSGAVAVKSERVDADYTKPAQVLEVIHGILGDRYMWGSDNPFMSWCSDGMAYIYTYKREAAVLADLSKKTYHDMLCVGPAAWLGDAANNRTYRGRNAK